MRKSDKKIEKSIVSALTEVCEDALKLHQGFKWLTHIVNYQAFPESLSIICIFDTNDNLSKTIESDMGSRFKASIEAKFISLNIKVQDIRKRIIFDTEEACESEHDGNWKKRLEGVKNARHV